MDACINNGAVKLTAANMEEQGLLKELHTLTGEVGALGAGGFSLVFTLCAETAIEPLPDLPAEVPPADEPLAE